MSARVTLCCDGSFDNGRMPCRGAWSLPVEAEQLLDDLVDVDDVRDAAERAGWSSTRAGATVRDYCPAHTYQRAARLLELDPRWASRPAVARSAVLDVIEADVAALKAAGGRLPDRAQLATVGVDPAAFVLPDVQIRTVRMTEAGLEVEAELTPSAFAELCADAGVDGWSTDAPVAIRKAGREPRPSSPACTATGCPTCERPQ